MKKICLALILFGLFLPFSSFAVKKTKWKRQEIIIGEKETTRPAETIFGIVLSNKIIEKFRTITTFKLSNYSDHFPPINSHASYTRTQRTPIGSAVDFARILTFSVGAGVVLSAGLAGVIIVVGKVGKTITSFLQSRTH